MQRSARKLGRAIGPIIDEATGEVVGWTYEWDNGETSRIVVADVHPRLHPEQGAPRPPQA